MTRNHITNDEVEAKSWVVLLIGRRMELHQSRWAVGYTDAHKETPIEALDYAIKQQELAMDLAQDRMNQIIDLYNAQVEKQELKL